MVALAACAGSQPNGTVTGRAQVVGLAAAPPVDVTATWDAQPPGGQGGGGPLVSLKAQWGTQGDLPLREIDARVVVEGPLAFTELHLVFENTTDHLIEANQTKVVVPSWARFDLRLPPGGALARFAVEHADGWREAEMVAVAREHPCGEDGWAPKALPQVVEEAPRHPGHFGANVEPIKPHSRKAVLVAFTQPLVSPGEPYRLSLLGLGPIERFRAIVHFPFASTATAFAVHKEAWTPDRDWVVQPPSSQPSALRSGRFAVARVDLPVDAAAPEPIGRVAFLLDTSASRAAGLHGDMDLLTGILKELGKASPSTLTEVAAFDQDVEPVYSGPPAGFGPAELARLAARGAFGATDLRPAFRWAAQLHPDRLVLLSDGVATLGGRTAADLAPDLDALRAAGAKRLDGAASGDEAGEGLLKTLASKLPSRGVVFGREEPTAAVAAALTHATTERLEVPGAVWSWPKEMAAGAPVLVFAELPPGLAFEVRVSGKAVSLDTREVASPFVAHEAARAEVARLEDALPSSASATDPARTALAELSTEYRVLSDESRWVVPISEHQYAALGVDRTKSPVLSAGLAGVVADPREPLHLLPAKRAECRPGPVPKGPGPGYNDLVGRTRSTPTRVLFEKGPEGLSQREFAAIKERLYQVVFPRNPAPGSLEVEGYCNESPVESENMRISRARARAFRDVLRDKLFAMWPDVQTRGYGSTPPLVGYYEYAWSDGWGPSSPQAQSRGATGSVGPPHKPALGDTPRGEIGVRLVVREPAKAATPAPPSQSQAASAALSAITTGLTSDPAHSERAFGSLLDLAPASASARRSAAAFLGRDAPVLSLDMLHEATALERDQSMMSRWALGMTLARAGKLDDAVDALASTLEAWLGVRSLLNGDMSDFRELERIFFPSPSTLDVLEQDLAVLGAAAAHDHPETKAKLEARLRPLGLELARRPSLRFVLTWESSADVDLEVEAGGKHWDPRASMDRDVFPGEGIVLADVRAFGPEAYVVNGAARAYPYRILARLYAASGDTFGRLDVVDYDGAGGVQVEEYPFVLRAEGETIEVATLRGPLAARKKAP
jgi:outer membrane protein OmpA-like peptidoglycan-associated protein